jgi:hypothetical protein
MYFEENSPPRFDGLILLLMAFFKQAIAKLPSFFYVHLLISRNYNLLLFGFDNNLISSLFVLLCSIVLFDFDALSHIHDLFATMA